MATCFRLNAQASNDALWNFSKAFALDPEFARGLWRAPSNWGRTIRSRSAAAAYVLGFVGGKPETVATFVDRARGLNPRFAPNWHFSGWLNASRRSLSCYSGLRASEAAQSERPVPHPNEERTRVGARFDRPQ
jgi:hypothetical protein